MTEKRKTSGGKVCLVSTKKKYPSCFLQILVRFFSLVPSHQTIFHHVRFEQNMKRRERGN
ncbi:hypothetical protein I7I48_06537 [Histoplasma ohiense]|nr:hypothetical protein I7I48_06537 [Histoplasma ohiense (nom. inval.)]